MGLHILKIMRIVLELWICFFLQWCNLRNDWFSSLKGKTNKHRKAGCLPCLPCSGPALTPLACPLPAHVAFFFFGPLASVCGTDSEGLSGKLHSQQGVGKHEAYFTSIGLTHCVWFPKQINVPTVLSMLNYILSIWKFEITFITLLESVVLSLLPGRFLCR